MTPEDLIKFEADIASEFNAGHIRAPIHLDGGNESGLIAIFKDVKPGDWCCCSWRAHAKALLHGVPPEEVKAEIMAGRSMGLCFPSHKFISSAIVGGIVPIAVGIALAIQRAGGNEKVFVFSGDMTATTGIYHECIQYAAGHALPIRFVVEDNGMSVCSETWETWGIRQKPKDLERRFVYHLGFQHSGAGKRIQF
jgi:TPP-dependent pyruvate/acetoin dehydrogenase alpha subunit